MPQPIRISFSLALLASIAMLFAGHRAGGAAPACSVPPEAPSLELVYRGIRSLPVKTTLLRQDPPAVSTNG
ncbi:MAG TPA: hypothetical protein VF729_06290 [Solirubrobacterales bacterium]